MLYGNLNEFSTILKDKQPKPRRIRKKQSLSDSEIKLSRDVSQSELSQRHERRNSSFLSSEGRNHLLDDQRIQMLSTDKQKSVEKLDYSKNGETIQNRLSKLEIFNDKDKTFSSKGPVMIKNDVQEQSDINDSIHEADSQFDSKKDIISQGKNIKENSLKDYLQTKIGETKHRNKSQKIIKNPSAEFNELVGFPSDDEDAQKQKNDIIDGISSDSHEAQSDTKSENKDNERNHKPIDTEEEAVPSHNPKVDEWTGFPSLSERTNIQEKDKQQTNLLETNSKEDNLSDDGRDKLDNAVDELFEESSIVGKDMLGFSDRSQMEFTAREEKKDDLMQDNPSPFSEKDMENNKSLHASREIEEDSQPQLPTDSLDVPGIDKIETIKESEDTEDNQKVQSLLADSPISKQQPSISDIMNDDLTGASQPPPNRRSRTEDDLPGSSNPKKTNSEKADMLTEELMFYLSMEMRNSLFPQRVNPTLLKQKTEKEIEQYEKRKEQESFSKESNPDSLPMSEPGQELEDEMPQHKMAIKTDAESTKEYLGILFSRVQGSEEDFITNLSSPLQRNPLEILMHLQNTQYELESYEQLPYHPSVLTVDIYLDIERTRKREQEEILKIEQEKAYEIHAKDKETKLKESESKVEEDKQMKSDNDKPTIDIKSTEGEGEQNSDAESEFTKDQEFEMKLFNLKCEWENIHNKAIFDSVNEALDGLRPYGLKGPPLSWSKQNRTLTYKNGHITEIPKILETVEKKVLGWIGDDDVKKPVNQVWEERLAVILVNEIEENEPLWSDYEFEETHVKIDMAEIITEELIKESIDILQNIKKTE